MRTWWIGSAVALALGSGLILGQGAAGHGRPAKAFPWSDTKLSPDKRADLVIAQMTLDEKMQLVHGTGWGVLRAGDPVPARSNLGAGFVAGIDRLGIPDINEADSAVGVRMAGLQSRYATLLPSALGAAASWDPNGAFLYGDVIGRELRAMGYNMSIGGGVNLMREPRNGRNFEYAGEDPVLAGTMTGNLMRGVQSNKVMGDIKHYAINDQETGRNILSVVIDKKAMRESDLLAFQIAIGLAKPSAVMCAYNKINGDYSCENDYTLNQVLKKDFGFKGFVLSDWEGTHSTVKAALAGLDQEQPGSDYFGDGLKKAVEGGQVPMARLNDMVHRVLRSMFEAGVVDSPPVREVVNPFRGLEDAQHIAEEGTVLLKNQDGVLPLSAGIKSIAIIGSHADVGVMSGGGSAQVDAPGGNAIGGPSQWGKPVYFPSSPLKYLQQKAPEAKVTYNAGTDRAAAAALARSSEVAIVFVTQFMSEGKDSETLSLPDNQDGLVSAVMAANPKTIVVLETGGPVSMPWSEGVKGIIEAWYPGIGGAQALANLMFGDVNFSGKLPATFARTDADLPHPRIAGMDEKAVQKPAPEAGGVSVKHPTGGAMMHASRKDTTGFDVPYPEGVRFGYKWFDSEKKDPLFPFGFGLSYTRYEYSNLKVNAAGKSVTFTVKNEGAKAGTEVAEVYAMLPSTAGESFKRMVGWQRIELAAGEQKDVTLKIDPLYLSVFDVPADKFTLSKGDYTIFVGGSSRSLPLTGALRVQ